MGNPIDLHVGKRIRRRRKLLGLTQTQLGEMVGRRFSQIQKYEGAINRVTASRLHELAVALNVPVGYFFEGLAETMRASDPANDRSIPADELSKKEMLELIRAYYALRDGPRRQLLSLAKALKDDVEEAAS